METQQGRARPEEMRQAILQTKTEAITTENRLATRQDKQDIFHRTGKKTKNPTRSHI